MTHANVQYYKLLLFRMSHCKLLLNYYYIVTTLYSNYSTSEYLWFKYKIFFHKHNDQWGFLCLIGHFRDLHQENFSCKILRKVTIPYIYGVLCCNIAQILHFYCNISQILWNVKFAQYYDHSISQIYIL